MSNRLDQEREKKLTPIRFKKALNELKKLLVEDQSPEDVFDIDETSIRFLFKSSVITYYPYSGWATGKTIKDGRGLNNLLKQLKS